MDDLSLYTSITPNWSHDKALAKGGYFCWLRNPDQHTNGAASYPGWGRTPKEAAEASRYWANQSPWCVITTASKTPRWVFEACERRQPDDF